MTFAGHQARKRFGQHWLTDPQVLDQIVAAAELQPGERVLEIGPGRGALTERLLASPAATLVAVELDRDLLEGLAQRFGADPRFRLISGDALAVPLEPVDQPQADKVVANIPYNITGPLLERLLGRLDRPHTPPYLRLVLLVQREVGERIAAAPGSGAYSALSVRLQLLARCRRICVVPPRCFSPPPKVHSEVIVIDPLPVDQRPAPEHCRAVERLLRAAFSARRKMLHNSLAALVPTEQLGPLAEQAGVDLDRRPQELAPGAWLALAAGLNRGSADVQGAIAG
jgi:16S rRNA (adenine1518-N6/adenine1519-N6)-dimethyltransferase